MYAFTLLTPPAAEPVSLAEQKLWSKVDVTDDDALIAANIRAARLYVEKHLGKQLVTATWKVTLDRFPSGWVTPGDWRGYPVGAWRSLSGNLLWPEFATIHLPRGPGSNVSGVSVQYIDAGGNLQTVDPTTYVVSPQDPPRLAPVYGAFWPVARLQVDAVRITYTVGYGPVTSIAAGVPGSGSQTVTPGTMVGIQVGSILTVDPGANQEEVAVTAVTSTTFTAVFQASHPAACVVNAVPDTIRTAIKMLASHWYERREAAGEREMFPVPFAVQSLLGMEWGGEYT